MKDIFKIFTIFNTKQQVYCVFIILCMVIGAILEAVGIGAILPLISIMGDENFLDNYIVIKQYAEMINITTHTSLIIFAAGLLIILYILKNLYLAWLTKLQINFSTQNQIIYAEALLSGYLDKPYLYHLEQNSATFLRNVSNGPISIFSGILIPTFTLLTEIITAVTIWSMLIFVDAFTTIIVAILLGTMMYGILKTFRKKITKKGEVQSKYSALYMKWLNQGLGAIKEIKVLRKEKFFLNEFVEAYQKFGQANGDFNLINQLPRMLIETMVTSALLILIIVKLMMGIKPVEIAPILGVLALAAFRLMPCANRIVNLSNGIKFQMPLFNLLYDELVEVKKRKLQYEIKTCEENKKLIFNKEIKVEELMFRYSKVTKEVIKQISFSIPKGSFVGIIGESGAGKTTFVDIMLGLLIPSNGKITVDGVDIFKNIRAWQENLAYVPQSIYLIDGSIRENIALGVATQEINDCKIEKVLKMAELYEFVEDLPEKTYTHVGERGVKLSGGQRQRIGIARALYYEPEVLILDEATSALDSEIEKNITDTILKLKGKITIIAIAHRVSTLANCDFKIKFKKGKVEILD